jgi:putative Holliday junction resolvase
MRILGLDYGDVRIGVAVSDPLGWTARGLAVITRKNPIDHKSSIEEIKRIIKEYEITKIILGNPKNMNNTEGENCRKVANFAKQLKQALKGDFIGITIELFDERLTTQRALRIFSELGVNTKTLNSKKKGQGSTDKMAARIILQGYLDAMEATAAQNNIKETNEMIDEKNANEELHFGMEDLDEEFEMETIIMTDEDGNEVEHVIVDEFEFKGLSYLVMMRVDDIDSDEVEAVIYKQVEVTEDEFVFEEISEDEYNELEPTLKQRLAEFDIDIQ